MWYNFVDDKMFQIGQTIWLNNPNLNSVLILLIDFKNLNWWDQIENRVVYKIFILDWIQNKAFMQIHVSHSSLQIELDLQ